MSSASLPTTMKALVTPSQGAPAEMRGDIPAPEPSPTQLLVKTLYAAVNPVDVFVSQFGQQVPGCEASTGAFHRRRCCCRMLLWATIECWKSPKDSVEDVKRVTQGKLDPDFDAVSVNNDFVSKIFTAIYPLFFLFSAPLHHCQRLRLCAPCFTTFRAHRTGTNWFFEDGIDFGCHSWQVLVEMVGGGGGRALIWDAVE
ncbi:zinc-binding oxidoreductase [Paraphaeosphaeria minitans]|uniref:Zinc-binding oxidoreductase n=1 Tax=Paraphaeosphaeria minitans TaxID=565426 RepID=A0A9P6KXA3_9PLEO|nr:zinc-binding oxidoreductase [Paraphaeosphaeria minitans]